MNGGGSKFFITVSAIVSCLVKTNWWNEWKHFKLKLCGNAVVNDSKCLPTFYSHLINQCRLVGIYEIPKLNSGSGEWVPWSYSITHPTYIRPIHCDTCSQRKYRKVTSLWQWQGRPCSQARPTLSTYWLVRRPVLRVCLRISNIH